METTEWQAIYVDADPIRVEFCKFLEKKCHLLDGLTCKAHRIILSVEVGNCIIRPQMCVLAEVKPFKKKLHGEDGVCGRADYKGRGDGGDDFRFWLQATREKPSACVSRYYSTYGDMWDAVLRYSHRGMEGEVKTYNTDYGRYVDRVLDFTEVDGRPHIILHPHHIEQLT